jgi:hypothetical protein
VTLSQNVEEKVRGKGQEEVWSGENVFLSLEVYPDLVFVCLFVVRSVESRSALDQNTSWVIVGYPRGRFYSHKEFSQLLSFYDGSTVVLFRTIPNRPRNEEC